ncbi:MAG TPA: ABC transporter substrate-binding protein [Acidimicrobiales bacterium]|nr:ABC transporter substrate-binding protein [Acidimicrobiales bacterium]
MTESIRSNPAAPSAAGRVLRGYAPVAVLALLFVLMAAIVPSTNVDERATAAGGGPVGVGSGDAADDGGSGETGAAGEPGTPGAGGSGTDAAAPGGGQPGAPAATGGCPDRAEQVPGDPYSPPCIAFEGDNGGATAKGVTAEEIIVSARILNEKGFQQTLAQLAGADITDEPEDVRRTIETLAEYFNRAFQFYGRKMKIVFYDGKGSGTTELQGGGQAEAEADAITSAEEIGAFAEINGSSAPFADALARKKVIAFGTPYLSRNWHVDRRPYNWSVATDCSIIVESVSEFANQTLANKPAKWAGGNLKNKPRKFAALSPDNPWYIDCVDQGIEITRAAGNPDPVRITYKLDIDSMSNQAANVIAKLKSEGVTTILCGCDPIIPVFLSTKATEQGYQPEWVVAGTALSDIDLVAQLYDQEQWSHAFGVSFLSSFLPIESGIGYSAYKSVRDDEPAFAVETIYAQMYMLALGIHMAGPNLTPETYEQGMFAYPGGSGPFGTWGFDEDSYTPTQDYRVIWYDPEATSAMNNKQGAYIEAYDGRRFKRGDLPASDQPPVFRQ